MISNSTIANNEAERAAVRFQSFRILSSGLNTSARVMSVAPIRRNVLDESREAIRFSCHSGVASLKGKELKMIVLRLNPIISQPMVAMVKAVFAFNRLRPTESESIEAIGTATKNTDQNFNTRAG